MKKIIPFLLMISGALFPTKARAQVSPAHLKTHQLSKEEYDEIKNDLVSRNLKIADTIFIKYDFDGESCWNALDHESKKHIYAVVKNFQNHIADFNATFTTAVAYNFRQPGKKFNKLKLWDDTIAIDEREIFKKLIFRNKVPCGSSAVIYPGGSYQIYETDPHFELLGLHHHYHGKKF